MTTISWHIHWQIRYYQWSHERQIVPARDSEGHQRRRRTVRRRKDIKDEKRYGRSLISVQVVSIPPENSIRGKLGLSGLRKWNGKVSHSSRGVQDFHHADHEKMVSGHLLTASIVIGLVNKQAFNGSRDDNPFNFQHFNAFPITSYVLSPGVALVSSSKNP